MKTILAILVVSCLAMATEEKLTKEEKARRMAEALRENLRKRKQQQRERDTPLERDAQAPAN